MKYIYFIVLPFSLFAAQKDATQGSIVWWQLIFLLVSQHCFEGEPTFNLRTWASGKTTLAWFSLNQSRKICNILFCMDSGDTFIQFPHKLNLLNLARVAECSTTQSMEYPSCKGLCRGQPVDPNILVVGFWPGDGTSALTVLGVIVWRIHSRVSNLGIELWMGSIRFIGFLIPPGQLREGYWGTVPFGKKWLNLQVCLYQPSPGIRRRLAQKSTTTIYAFWVARKRNIRNNHEPQRASPNEQNRNEQNGRW